MWEECNECNEFKANQCFGPARHLVAESYCTAEGIADREGP